MSNFNQNKIVIDKNELQKIYKRQLDLVKENQELTKDIEYRDYRIMKLEKELREMQSRFIRLYGTLKRGCRNNHYLSEATFLGEAETVEKYSMRRHKYCYPAVIETLEHYNIKGELWCCSDWVLKSLDRLEGTPDLFYRKEVPII